MYSPPNVFFLSMPFINQFTLGINVLPNQHKNTFITSYYPLRKVEFTY